MEWGSRILPVVDNSQGDNDRWLVTFLTDVVKQRKQERKGLVLTHWYVAGAGQLVPMVRRQRDGSQRFPSRFFLLFSLGP